MYPADGAKLLVQHSNCNSAENDDACFVGLGHQPHVLLRRDSTEGARWEGQVWKEHAGTTILCNLFLVFFDHIVLWTFKQPFSCANLLMMNLHCFLKTSIFQAIASESSLFQAMKQRGENSHFISANCVQFTWGKSDFHPQLSCDQILLNRSFRPLSY